MFRLYRQPARTSAPMHNALVHPIGDVETLSRHITQLYEAQVPLQRLRETCIRERLEFTWKVAGERLKARKNRSDRYGAVRGWLRRANQKIRDN